MTPHLVEPIEAGVKLALPTDHFIEPTLSEFYWDGRLEGRAPLPKGDEKDEKDENKEGRSSALDQGAQSTDLAQGAAGYIDGTEAEIALGGFMGPTGYRIESPKPTGGIQ